jgi:hypothetical protein
VPPGQIVLDDSGSGAVINRGAEGLLTIKAHPLPAEVDRPEAYRKRFRVDLAERPSLDVGFLLLEGAVGIETSDEVHRADDSPNVMRLISSLPAGLRPRAASEAKRIELAFTWPYRVVPRIKEEWLPISLVPSLVSQTGRRVLDLALQWDNRYGNLNLDVDRIEILELRVPATWGQVEAGSDSIFVSPVSNEERSIEWRGLLISEEDRAVRNHTLTVKFENEIIDLSASLRGQVDLVLRSTLSGIETARLFYPLGTPRDERPNEIETHVKVEFDLSLSGLRYSDMKRPDDLEELFVGVVPDHEAIIGLTGALSESDFYVQRVVENPPRPGGQLGDRTRSWDIAGRRYRGVYPIDFHIRITGTETSRFGGRPETGTAKAAMSVWGAYANSDMEQDVLAVKDRLKLLLEETLGRFRRAVIELPQQGDGRRMTFGLEQADEDN